MSEFTDEDVRNAVAFVPVRTTAMRFSAEEAAKFDRWLAAHTPTDDEREAHRRVIDLWFANWRSIGKVSPALEVAIDSLEGMVSDALDAGFRRSEVPEPSAEVIGEWFTSSHGVAVAAVAPMTDRGPAVMVDGRVICPNDIAALIEFKAQGEPSDALRDAIDHVQGAVEFQDAINPEAVRVVISAALGRREPSDAQVLAALNATARFVDEMESELSGWDEERVRIMRAALRAAGGEGR